MFVTAIGWRGGDKYNRKYKTMHSENKIEHLEELNCGNKNEIK